MIKNYVGPNQTQNIFAPNSRIKVILKLNNVFIIIFSITIKKQNKAERRRNFIVRCTPLLTTQVFKKSVSISLTFSFMITHARDVEDYGIIQRICIQVFSTLIAY